MMQQRPIGISILAVLYLLGGVSSFLGGIATLFIPLPNELATFTLVFGILGVLIGAVDFAIAWGMWMGMNWARITAIVLSVISLLSFLIGGIVYILGVNIGGYALSFPGVGAGMIIFAIIEGMIIYYLVRPEVDAFFSGSGSGSYQPDAGAYVETTVAAPEPEPVMPARRPAAPEPVVSLPRTEIIGVGSAPSAWLVARTGPRVGKEYGLQRGRNLIGRDGAQCDIVLDDTAVSKLHAEVRYENGQFVLFDHASTNGTFVNNRLVQRQSLLDGDDIRIGNAGFVFKEVKLRSGR